MEDMVELLLYVSRFKPMVLEGLPMEELLLFFVTFMGSPDFIHNPYLRSRMIEVSILARCLAFSVCAPLRGGRPRTGHDVACQMYALAGCCAGWPQLPAPSAELPRSGV